MALALKMVGLVHYGFPLFPILAIHRMVVSQRYGRGLSGCRHQRRPVAIVLRMFTDWFAQAAENFLRCGGG